MSHHEGNTETGIDVEVVHVAIYPTMADWEIGHLTSGINNPMWQATPGRFRIATVAGSPDPIETMGGLRILPDLTFDAVDPADSAMLVLAGADLWEIDPPAPAITAAIRAARAFVDAEVPVAAICGATGGLARAGLLDRRAHTSSALDYLRYRGGPYAGADHYRDEPAVTDRGVITAGPTNPVEFARAVFAALGVFTPEVLDAWYRLFGLQDSSAYGVLAQAAAQTPAPGRA